MASGFWSRTRALAFGAPADAVSLPVARYVPFLALSADQLAIAPDDQPFLLARFLVQTEHVFTPWSNLIGDYLLFDLGLHHIGIAVLATFDVPIRSSAPNVQYAIGRVVY